MDRIFKLIIEVRKTVRRIVGFAVPWLFLWPQSPSNHERFADLASSHAFHSALLFLFV
jgi:hypothetical protein